MTPLKRFPALALMVALSFPWAVSQTEKPASQGAPASWKQVPVPPLRPFHPQQPRRVELPNGLIVFLQEDHELPLIDGNMRIRGGGRDEPADKIGLSDIYAEAWRTGGTTSKTGDELDDFLESRAAHVETSANANSTFLSWSSLKDDFNQVLPVVMDLLRNPEFRQDKIDLAQQQLAGEIARRNDSLNQIAFREAAKLAYGTGNPYARTPEYSTLAAITRDDLVAWHKRTAVPNNIIVEITGDFDTAAMEGKLRDVFAGLPRGEPFPKTQIAFHQPNPGIYFIEKDDVNQSVIDMVDLGIERRNPDYYAVEVMNEIFGGGFSSRLFSSIRTRQGLAYSVGGGVGSDFDHPGMMRISMATKSGSTAAAIDALNQQIAELLQGNVTEEEMKRAKDGILNSFIFRFDSRDKVLTEIVAYEFYGYPADFLERYRAAIEKVTVADVNRVARKYIHRDKLAVLVVGNSKDFDRALATFGKVTAIDISIPPPPQKKNGL